MSWHENLSTMSWHSTIKLLDEKKKLMKVVVIIVSLIIVLLAICWSHWLNRVLPVKTLMPPTAIYMECHLTGLPLYIPPHDSLHLIPLNKKRIKTVKWGFYDIHNDGIKEKQWPEEKQMQLSKTKHNFGVFVYKCEVSNHGPINLLSVSIPLSIWFGNEKPDIKYSVIISPLDAGKTFPFYLVNDCPGMVNAVFPDSTLVQVLGETEKRQVPLRRSYRSPIDQIMMFMPNSMRWIGGEPCD